MRQQFTLILTLIAVMSGIGIAPTAAQDPTPGEDNDVTIIVPRLAETEEPTEPITTVPNATPTSRSRAPIREIVQYEPYQIPTDVNPLTGPACRRCHT